MEMYKVRHKTTGLFWKGGSIPNYLRPNLFGTTVSQDQIDLRIYKLFNKNGKVYHSRRFVESAFTNAKSNDDVLYYILMNECEIVIYNMVEIGVMKTGN